MLKTECSFCRGARALIALVLVVLAGCASIPSAEIRQGLAPTGTLRVGLNMGNTLLTAKDPASGEPRGVATDISRELGRRLGVPVKFFPYASSGLLSSSIDSGQWDIAFFAVEGGRANQVEFTPGYVDIDATYLVRRDSSLRTADDVDRPGLVVATTVSAGYLPTLIKTLRQARLVRTGKVLTDIVGLLDEGKADAVVGLRPMLIAHAEQNPSVRVVDGQFMSVQQAIGLHKGRAPASSYLREFVQDIKQSGLLADIITKNGVRGLTISPP